MAPHSTSKKRKAKTSVSGVKAGPGDVAAEGKGPPAKAPKKGNKGKDAKSPGASRIPEASEVLEISRTQNLYKSNLFRLQLDELIKQLAPRRAQDQLETFLRSLKAVLEGLTERTIPGNFAAEFPELHFHHQQPSDFAFGPPKRIDIVGSFLLGTNIRAGETTVDVAVEMPSDAFRSKDYLNFRYLDKRSAYAGELHRQLAALRGALLAGVEVGMGWLQQDPFRPCVCLRAPKEGAVGQGPWVVRLLPVYAADLFPASKLAPDRNLVRPADGPEVGAALPTPHYNSSLLEDARMRAHLELVHQSLQRTPALREAILLLKRWAAARSLLPPPGPAVFVPLSGFCLSVMAIHACQVSAASQASSFQIFKLALGVFATTDWATQRLTLGATAAAALSAEEVKLRVAHFYDTDGLFNFFWRLGPFIGEIQWEAQRVLRLLDTQADPFEAVFGQQASSPALHWDLAVRSPALGPGALCPSTPLAQRPADLAASLVAADAPEALSLASRLAAVLREGLGDRCLRAIPRLVAGEGGGIAVVIGVTLEALNLERALDRGPAAESAEAQRFRSLWGPEKSELRRFKDGSVLECAVWARPPPGRHVESQKQPSVATQIIRHLLQQHFPQVAEGSEILAGPVGVVHNLGERERRLWSAFEAFRGHLCQLSSLPLSIKDVHPVDASFSYTALAPRAAPKSDAVSRTLQSVVVEFESSGRWPEDPAAARKVAGALLLQMKEELQTDLGVEAGVTEEFLDVRYPEFVFRIHIFHEHEFLSIAHRVTNFSAPLGAPLPDAEALERLRALWWRPRVRASLHAHVLQRPAMAGAVRLCKRWLTSQLLSGYEEFAEHLIAAVFLKPTPFETPTSPQVALCRVCWLLDAHDWEREPLVVDFDGKLSSEQYLTMRHSFERSRSDAAGAGAFWICSRFDPHAMLLNCPPPTVGAWLRRRAQQALGVCHQRLLGLARGWEALFALETSVFDVLLRLRGRAGAEGSRAAALGEEALESLVGRLRARLSPVCLVFYSTDSNVLALKWRPGAFFPQPQNVLMGAVPHSVVPQAAGQPPLCVPDVLCLVSAVVALAEGLVTEVSVLGARGQSA